MDILDSNAFDSKSFVIDSVVKSQGVLPIPSVSSVCGESRNHWRKKSFWKDLECTYGEMGKSWEQCLGMLGECWRPLLRMKSNEKEKLKEKTVHWRRGSLSRLLPKKVTVHASQGATDTPTCHLFSHKLF